VEKTLKKFFFIFRKMNDAMGSSSAELLNKLYLLFRKLWID
jgi:hypothetical protein